MVKIALVSRMVSDLTGQEADESAFVTLTVRSHPSIDSPRALDVLPDEIAKLKSAGDLVVLEVGNNGDKQQIVVTLAEFRKLVKDDIVKNARATRGRRPGFSPSAAPKPEPAPAAKAPAKKSA